MRPRKGKSWYGLAPVVTPTPLLSTKTCKFTGDSESTHRSVDSKDRYSSAYGPARDCGRTLTKPYREGMPPRVFSQKSLQAIENKGMECEKERKERQRGGKLLRTWGLPPRPGRGRQEHRGDGKDAQRAENGTDIDVT